MTASEIRPNKQEKARRRRGDNGVAKSGSEGAVPVRMKERSPWTCGRSRGARTTPARRTTCSSTAHVDRPCVVVESEVKAQRADQHECPPVVDRALGRAAEGAVEAARAAAVAGRPAAVARVLQRGARVRVHREVIGRLRAGGYPRGPGTATSTMRPDAGSGGPPVNESLNVGHRSAQMSGERES